MTEVDLRAVGRDLQADGALADDDLAVVERRDQHVSVPGHEFLGGLEPRGQRRGDLHQLGAVGLDRPVLTSGAVLGTTTTACTPSRAAA